MRSVNSSLYSWCNFDRRSSWDGHNLSVQVTARAEPFSNCDANLENYQYVKVSGSPGCP